MQFQPLGWEDPLEEGTAAHSSVLAWRTPCTEEPGGLQSTGSQNSFVEVKTLRIFPIKPLSWLTPMSQTTHNQLNKQSELQFSSVTQSYLTLCNPMNCSTPGLPVHHQLPELVQTHVH